MHRPLMILFCAGAVSLACSAAAPCRAAPEQDITVTRNPEKQEAVRAMTRAISRIHERQLARFESKACIAVKGLSAPYDGIMQERMARDATEAGVAVGHQGCAPNVVVVIADNMQEELRRLARDKSSLLQAGLEDNDLKAMLRDAGPVHVVTATELHGGDGTLLHPSALLQRDAAQLTTHEVSIIHPVTRQDIASVLVLIDSKATLGKNLQQLADYAALRSLADLKDDQPTTAEPSILALFANAQPPAGLTTYDRAYLKGLYSGPSTMTAEARFHEITVQAMHPPSP